MEGECRCNPDSIISTIKFIQQLDLSPSLTANLASKYDNAERHDVLTEPTMHRNIVAQAIAIGEAASKPIEQYHGIPDTGASTHCATPECPGEEIRHEPV